MINAQRAKDLLSIKDMSRLAPLMVASVKYDGIWAALKYERGKFVAFQTRGKELINNCKQIVEDAEALESFVPKDNDEFYIIGELCVPHCKASQVTARCVTRLDYTEEDAYLMVHDCVTLHDGSVAPYTYVQRLGFISKLITTAAELGVSSTLQIVNSRAVEIDNLQKYADNIWRLGGEGAIFRDPASVYKPGSRCNDMLKLKEMQDFDLLIVGAVEGEGKFAGMIGSLIAQDSTGKQFVIGGGALRVKERQDLWDSLPEINGPLGIAEVRCMLVTPDGELREPRFVHWRRDKTYDEVQEVV